MEENLRKYRQYLVETEQKVSESYDKTVLTLSSGGLAISFAFLKDVIGIDEIQSKAVLFLGWGMLTVSLASVVLSLFLGTIAFRQAIKQIDADEIHSTTVGGWSAKVTAVLHFSGVVFLIAGISTLGIFLFINL